MHRSPSSSASSPSFVRALLSAAVLSALAGCNSAVPPRDDVASPPLASPQLGTTTHAQRTRQGRAAPLLAFAREVGVNASAASTPEALSSDAGAGSSDGGAPPSVLADAGPLSPEPPSPEPPSPEDIVEQSALPIYGLEAGIRLEEPELWDRLAESSAVCFGEYHDVAAHHYAQARALDELAARAEHAGRPLAIGYEMFQRPFQAPLSAFVAGELGEPEFLAQTEYATRWGLDFALYRPLLERTRDHGLAALALNMQREITRKIGRMGLASLTDEERALLPELVLDDAEHRAYIFGLFGVLPEHAEQFGLENVYVAQTVWDETMADTSARWLIANTTREGARASVLAFAGGAHCHRSAIPRRISRRTGEPALSVHPVFESELADGSFSPEGYDLLVVLDD